MDASTVIPPPPARAPWWLPVAGLVGALCVLVVAGLSRHQAVVVGCYLSGLSAVVSGLVVIRSTRRSTGRARASMLLLGSAIFIWGAGQCLVGVYLALGSDFPTPADWLSTMAAPLGIAGLLVTPRQPGRRADWVRLALDSALLGASLSLVVWRVAFLDVIRASIDTTASLSVVTMLLLEIVVVALLLLAWLRDLDRGLLLVVVGLGMYSAADLATLHEMVLPGGQWPWWSAMVWCVCWPLIAVGLLMYDLRASLDREPYRSETRVTTATTVLSLVAVLAFMVSLVHSPSLDHVSEGIFGVLLVLYAGREVFGSWQRRRLVAGLTEQALRDPLTGLRNRRGVALQIQTLHRVGGSVLTLDLDGFKRVNDILGHSRGDALLVRVSRRIEACLPPGAEAFRIGGDEFAVLVPGSLATTDLAARRLLEAVRGAAADIPGVPAVGVSVSIGVSRFVAPRPVEPRRGDAHPAGYRGGVAGAVGTKAEDESDAMVPLVESGAAMNAAKRSGRDRVERYAGVVGVAHQRSLFMGQRLHEAVSSGALDVHYQPVVDLRSGRVVGVEALARWDDPRLGVVEPGEFIPLAERSGLIVALGDLVLRRAVSEFVAAPAEVARLGLAVNVSPVQLRRSLFTDEVIQLARDHGMSPSTLTLEVTESSFVDPDDVGLAHLRRLRDAGFGVAIDDFGSGFSALGYLGRLPATTIKVDRSLTTAIVRDGRSLAVLQAVTDLGASLPVDVIVEGIETAEVQALVRATGAGYGQGWLYSHAVPMTQLPEVVHRLDRLDSLGDAGGTAAADAAGAPGRKWVSLDRHDAGGQGVSSRSSDRT